MPNYRLLCTGRRESVPVERGNLTFVEYRAIFLKICFLERFLHICNVRPSREFTVVAVQGSCGISVGQLIIINLGLRFGPTVPSRGAF
jgi:hypothetical protein